MRLRFRVLYRILTLLGTVLLILVLIFLFVKEPGSDKYITIIPEKSVDKVKSLSADHGLLNLTNFEFLIENNLCHMFKKELLGKLLVNELKFHEV